MISKSELQERLNDWQSTLEENFAALRTFRDIRAVSWGQSVRSIYVQIAQAYLFLDQLTESKKAFYKATCVTLETLLIFQKNKYPNLVKTEQLKFHTFFVNSFIDAILSDSPTLLKEYSETITPDTDPVESLRFNHEITCALKYLVLGQTDRAKQHAVAAHKPEYFSNPYKGFSYAVLGIISNDVDLVNEGIKYRIDHNIKSNKGSIFYDISLEATALAKLATQAGITPDLQSPFINKGLVERTDHIKFDGINEINEALTAANKRGGGLIDKIGGLFK